MKNILFSTLLLGLIAGCDAPQRTRAPRSFENLNGAIGPNGQPISGTTVPGGINYEQPGALGGAATTGTTSGTTGTAPDSNFPSCDLTSKYHTVDVGYFGLCQSTVSESLFKVKFTQTTTTRNCLLPLYKDAAGSSTYIGQPQCTAVNQADQVISGTLYKNRSGFESYPLNGVIVMKEPLLPEYFSCMHAYIKWLPQACPQGPNTSNYCYQWMPMCPYGAKTNATCDQGARAYMAQICNAFKSKYSNAYIDIRTK